MNLGRIFGATFFSVVAALVAYDLVGKNLLSKISGYDNTNFNGFNPADKSGSDYFIANGKVYRVTQKRAA